MNIKAEIKRICKAQAILELIEKAENKITALQEWRESKIFPFDAKDEKKLFFTTLAKERLEKYYKEIITQ